MYQHCRHTSQHLYLASGGSGPTPQDFIVLLWSPTIGKNVGIVGADLLEHYCHGTLLYSWPVNGIFCLLRCWKLVGPCFFPLKVYKTDRSRIYTYLSAAVRHWWQHFYSILFGEILGAGHCQYLCRCVSSYFSDMTDRYVVYSDVNSNKGRTGHNLIHLTSRQFSKHRLRPPSC
jgi:hypothetical protein